MKKVSLMLIIVALIFSLGACATQKPRLIYQPPVQTVAEVPTALPAMEVPRDVQVETWVGLRGDKRRTFVLFKVISAYWGDHLKFKVVSDTGHGVVVIGPGGTRTVPISDKLLADLEKAVNDKNGEASLEKLCPKQAKLLREAMGPVGGQARKVSPSVSVAAPVPAQVVPATSGCQDQPFSKGGFWNNVAPGQIAEVKVKPAENLYKISLWSVDSATCSPIDCYRTPVLPTSADFAGRWGGTWVLERSWLPKNDGGQHATIQIYRKIN